MKNWSLPVLLLASLALSPIASASPRPVALIYRGPGACTGGCFESPAAILRQMGYDVRFVGPDATDPTIFLGVALWLQPGGLVEDQNAAMNPVLKDLIKNYVRTGGRYIGICAGAFLASETYGWGFRRPGLGFLSGHAALYRPTRRSDGRIPIATIFPTQVHGQNRDLYWEVGPVFPQAPLDADIVSRYPGGEVAALRKTVGNGRVYVTAFHPEAPTAWRDYYQITSMDTDGLDYDVLQSMVRWAVQP